MCGWGWIRQGYECELYLCSSLCSWHGMYCQFHLFLLQDTLFRFHGFCLFSWCFFMCFMYDSRVHQSLFDIELLAPSTNTFVLPVYCVILVCQDFSRPHCLVPLTVYKFWETTVSSIHAVVLSSQEILVCLIIVVYQRNVCI